MLHPYQGTSRYRQSYKGLDHSTPFTPDQPFCTFTKLFNLACWNVHTLSTFLCPGMSSKDIMTHKIAELDRKLARFNINICALSGMRLTGMGRIHEVEYTIFWCGKEEDEVWQHGVELAAQNSLMACINLP